MRPAPQITSPNAAQFASFDTRTGKSTAVSSISLRFVFLNGRFDAITQSFLIIPGVPTPIPETVYFFIISLHLSAISETIFSAELLSVGILSLYTSFLSLERTPNFISVPPKSMPIQSFEYASLSHINVTSVCTLSIDAGISVEIRPLSNALTASCLLAPQAIMIILRAFSIVPIPIVNACFGTSSILLKNLELASIVFSVKSVK